MSRTATERAGRVLLLNGASSAGKSSLASALQETLAAAGQCWAVFSWDDFVPRLPTRWHGGPDEVGDFAADGCSYTLRDDGPDRAALLEVGEVGFRMVRGYHRAIAAVARAGNDVIVEEVMITAREWDDWTQALSGLPVVWVGVRCDTDVVVRREHDRGDRYPGLARGTSLAVHRYATYDLEVNTTRTPTNELAEALAGRVDELFAGRLAAPGGEEEPPR